MFDDATRIKAIDNEEANQAIEIKATLLKSIDEMELSVRSHNCLQAAGINQISDFGAAFCGQWDKNRFS